MQKCLPVSRGFDRILAMQQPPWLFCPNPSLLVDAEDLTGPILAARTKPAALLALEAQLRRHEARTLLPRLQDPHGLVVTRDAASLGQWRRTLGGRALDALGSVVQLQWATGELFEALPGAWALRPLRELAASLVAPEHQQARRRLGRARLALVAIGNAFRRPVDQRVPVQLAELLALEVLEDERTASAVLDLLPKAPPAADVDKSEVEGGHYGRAVGE